MTIKSKTSSNFNCRDRIEISPSKLEKRGKSIIDNFDEIIDDYSNKYSDISNEMQCFGAHNNDNNFILDILDPNNKQENHINIDRKRSSSF
jgi:hypothetical protein